MSWDAVELEALVLGAVRDTPLLVLVFDQEPALAWLNPAAEEALQVAREDAVGLPSSRVVQGQLPTLEGVTARAEGDFALVRSDGSFLHVQGHLSRVRDLAGRRLGTALVVSLTAPGSEWHYHLLRSSLPAAIGMVGAEVAHQINNPVTWLRLNIDQLHTDLNRLETLDFDLARELFDECQEGLERIGKIAGELRELAAPTPHEVRETDLRELVAAACSLAPFTPEGPVLIRRELADVPHLSLAAGRVGQAIWALLSLTVRMAGPGETLPSLQVRLHDDGQHVYLDICLDRALDLPPEAMRTGAKSQGPVELRMARTVLSAHGGLVIPVPGRHGLRVKIPIVEPPYPLI
jgi:nitrogen fixation/metabolism regulation signal transduction histidine kinase